MIFISRPLLIALSFTVLLVSCNNVSIKKNEQAAASVTHTSQAVIEPSPSIPPATVKYGSVWERIRAGYSLPHASNNTVDAQIRFYTSKKKYFYGVMQQSEPYLYYVASEMQANNMPMELALLPFIESSYNPTASSPGNQNVGMWQFGAGTGRTLGLSQTSNYDGRRDVIASTDAAIRLLKKLYTRFDNDWLLAVAAYNAGDGTIQQAIDKNRRAGKPTDFWSLPLNKTTQGYIPQLIALSKIVADPTIYDFNLYPIPDAPYFVKVDVTSSISLADAAKHNALDIGMLKRLNAGFKNGLTNASEPRPVLIPISAAENFKASLTSLPQKMVTQPVSSTENISEANYTVKPGENLWSIAKAKKTSVDNLARLNNISTKSVLKPGQKILIPSSNKVSSSTIKDSPTQQVNATPASEKQTAASSVKNLKYTVKSGDTLGKIAAQHKVSVKQLMQWNKIKDETSIRPKQELMVLAEPKN